jgi:hypothetical protein
MFKWKDPTHNRKCYVTSLRINSNIVAMTTCLTRATFSTVADPDLKKPSRVKRVIDARGDVFERSLRGFTDSEAIGDIVAAGISCRPSFFHKRTSAANSAILRTRRVTLHALHVSRVTCTIPDKYNRSRGSIEAPYRLFA